LLGYRQGYKGLIENDMYDMAPRSVSNILNLGGTILKTARCLEFRTDEGMETAYQNIKAQGIDAWLLLAAMVLLQARCASRKKYPDIAVIGVPGTIDNDLYGINLYPWF
jgi:6-phosphofructokinase 1